MPLSHLVHAWTPHSLCGSRTWGKITGMRITSKADYAVRAMIELSSADELLTAEDFADRQGIPVRFPGHRPQRPRTPEAVLRGRVGRVIRR
ncbi:MULTISPECIES: Rrf2 family transcriptional regulator [unclassified Actinopolyspora]|uniref:Rrf2 family transcriptional regulator n=1 Tax=unclassified Actinopolyspora TaxID=2639451 RepID=UPI0013F5E0C4|nr:MULTISPECIES: Rrf2 family transcriptional regulator [unclassified Actinopolyspora]NHD15640.1 Rrf2 family transcriptional regulator [Actinopolyspora sp. BKK2]NHE75147.1 Rrf2 family transcriptional regulator [Actinopolyspora sp. BKK1]